MIKQEYIDEIKKIADERISLREREIEVTKNYIDSNKKFEIGQRVKVVSKDEKNTEFGYISNIKIGYKGELEYEMFKEKKDGKPSRHKLWFWSGYKIYSENEI